MNTILCTNISKCKATQAVTLHVKPMFILRQSMLNISLWAYVKHV